MTINTQKLSKKQRNLGMHDEMKFDCKLLSEFDEISMQDELPERDSLADMLLYKFALLT